MVGEQREGDRESDNLVILGGLDPYATTVSGIGSRELSGLP